MASEDELNRWLWNTLDRIRLHGPCSIEQMVAGTRWLRRLGPVFLRLGALGRGLDRLLTDVVRRSVGRRVRALHNLGYVAPKPETASWAITEEASELWYGESGS